MPGRTGIIIASIAVLLTAMLLFGLRSTAKPATAAGETHLVTIQGMKFQPERIEIAPGDSITWVNKDILMHAVKSTDPKNPWQSKDLPPQESWTKTFSEGGAYICPYHPTMTGEVILRH